nr:MAG TPA: hypothetical protein [Caudoviricetes sp.]
MHTSIITQAAQIRGKSRRPCHDIKPGDRPGANMYAHVHHNTSSTD